ncbi:NAD-dependent epimerase/dehydratase family protein [Kineococcus aurantiacus]|uniref:UDP-glucose 4-epimerase n=1 Tax=Kineococcus aurantiacus TaxID=37633 RepID=A0A7Y9DNI0_9ACTN|nr:NAD-dependent epimerase/dehydratase family protein [Kineococcus aurantiacus]NYD23774.1 UDP-glucose 4-epimerase [Kineococcus aurantiacus]
MAGPLVVTGAAGRLGRRVVARAVRAGWEVREVDVTGVAGGAVDVTSPGALAGVLDGAAALVHLAARPSPVGVDAHEVLSVNLGGTLAALLAAEATGTTRVVLASSVNATGAAYSRAPRYDAFPVTEAHASYAEDPYALSKFLGEQAADAFARRRPAAVLTSLRFHALREGFAFGDRDEDGPKDLWGWVSFEAAAAACLRAVGRAGAGHVVANVVAVRTTSRTPTAELSARFHPGVPWTAEPRGHRSFYATDVARDVLGWDAADDDPAVTDAERPWSAP